MYGVLSTGFWDVSSGCFRVWGCSVRVLGLAVENRLLLEVGRKTSATAVFGADGVGSLA